MNKINFSLFNIPNIFTTANLVCGLISILFTFSNRIELAPYPLLLAAIFDFFDGFFARLLNQGSEIGKQLDSFADLISFGLAPGFLMIYFMILSIDKNYNESSFIVIEWFSKINWKEAKNLVPFIAFIIPIFSMFRLAKFNLDTRQTDRFIGLPTPANTLFFCSLPFIYANCSHTNQLICTYVFTATFLVSICFLFSFLLIAEIPLIALKFKNFSLKTNFYKYLLILLSIGIILSCI